MQCTFGLVRIVKAYFSVLRVTDLNGKIGSTEVVKLTVKRKWEFLARFVFINHSMNINRFTVLRRLWASSSK